MNRRNRQVAAVLALGVMVLASLAGQAQESTRNGILRTLTDGQISVLDRTSEGDPGRIITFTRTPQTALENCDTTAVLPGAQCAVTYVINENETYTATQVYFFSCSEQGYVYGTITATGPTWFRMQTAGIDSPFPRAAEITVFATPDIQLTTCTNRPLPLADLEVGRSIGVYGTSDRDARSMVVSSGGYTDDCPITTYVVGPITEKTDTSIVVQAEGYGELLCLVPIGSDGSGTRNNSLVQVDDCRFKMLTWDDFTIGDTLGVTATIFREEPSEIGSIVVYSDCGVDSVYIPGSLATVVGSFEELTDSTVTVTATGGNQVTFGTNAETMFVDCVGRRIKTTQFRQGDVVYAYGPRDGGVMIARAVINASNCTSEIVDCVVESATPTTMVVRIGSGRSILVQLAEDAEIIDCSGTLRESTDPAFIEKYARATLDVALDPPVLRAITVDIDCPTVDYVDGTIVLIEERALMVQTARDSFGLERGKAYFSDANGEMIAWEDLAVGDAVCAQVADVRGVPTFAIVTVGISCDGESRPLIAKGSVVESSPDHLTIRTTSGDVEFAVNDKTSVDGAVTLLSIESGSRVTVRSREKLRSHQPIASSVAVEESTTSVDDRETGFGSLLVAPNPAQDLITIAAPTLPTQIQICAMDGRVQLVGTATDRMDIKDLPNGAYLVVLTFGDATRHTSLLRVLR